MKKLRQLLTKARKCIRHIPGTKQLCQSAVFTNKSCDGLVQSGDHSTQTRYKCCTRIQSVAGLQDSQHVPTNIVQKGVPVHAGDAQEVNPGGRQYQHDGLGIVHPAVYVLDCIGLSFITEV